MHRDIVFARRDTGDLLLDLHRPATGHPVPVVLWLHGGGWFTGDRTLAPDLGAGAAATGCALASIEYRLSGQALFPAQLHDVRAAIRFLRANAERFGLDPSRIGVWGASAGGHLAALAGLTGHIAALPDEFGASEADGGNDAGADASVQAVAESYGPVDLAECVAGAAAAGGDGSRTPEARLLGGLPADRAELARQASPLTWVSAAAPPFQISHGTGDVLVSHRQSERLHAALVSAGVESDLYLVEGYKHGFLNPAGRLDVDLAAVMDDGRLAAEGTAAALHRGSGAQNTPDSPGATDGRTTFGFRDIHDFFRRHLVPGTD
ncbi:hypothetical protein GCM10023081_18920 [Arthrobacter ginkgonis]|uniref:BD-FAE-like domain-containing protein n=1 Tax=Arthrobacter ginkgonis TaxID=1630594 RepID=A0ABP7C9U0_9MICC